MFNGTYMKLWSTRVTHSFLILFNFSQVKLIRNETASVKQSATPYVEPDSIPAPGVLFWGGVAPLIANGRADRLAAETAVRSVRNRIRMPVRERLGGAALQLRRAGQRGMRAERRRTRRRGERLVVMVGF